MKNVNATNRPIEDRQDRSKTAGLPDAAAEIPGDAREKVRAALLALAREGAKVTLSTLRARAGVDRSAAATLLRLYRAGELDLGAPWRASPAPGPLPPPTTGAAPSSAGEATLERLIAAITRGKTDPAAIAEAGTLAAELVARGLLAEGAARTICTMLTEARRALADARATAPPDPFAEAIQILMPEEWAVVEAYRASRAVPPLKRFSLFCRTRTRT